MLDNLLFRLLRRKTPVMLSDLKRTTPVSRVFGLDRGTPIDRYYVEKFLKENASLIRGRVLEVGDDRYARRFGGDSVDTFDILDTDPTNKKATLIADLTDRSSLPQGRFDCFICTQTFNFIFDVTKAIQGAHHLLKPGGTLLATVSGISQISRYDMDRWGDYWRFTTASLPRLLEPIFTGGCGVHSFGNVLAATAMLQGVVVEDLPTPALLDDLDPDYQVTLTVVARKAA